MKNFIYRNVCELCGSTEYSVIISKPFKNAVHNLTEYYNTEISEHIFENASFELVCCKKCGFMWQTYIFNDAYMDLLYGSWINEKISFEKRKNASVEMYTGYARQAERISHILKKHPSHINVLDFGMGWGFWAIMCAAFGYNVWGAELAESRITFAAAHGIKIVSDINTIQDEKFHFINSEQVFEHIPQPLKTLQKLTDILYSRGIIRIAVPDSKNIRSSLSQNSHIPQKGAAQPLEHINSFTRETLIFMAEKAGLKLYTKPLLNFNKNNVCEYVQELVRSFYRNRYGTSLYFIKN